MDANESAEKNEKVEEAVKTTVVPTPPVVPAPIPDPVVPPAPPAPPKAATISLSKPPASGIYTNHVDKIRAAINGVITRRLGNTTEFHNLTAEIMAALTR